MTQVDLKLWEGSLTPFGLVLLPLHLWHLCPCNAVIGKGEQLGDLTETLLLHSLFSISSWSFPTAYGQEAVGAHRCEWENRKSTHLSLMAMWHTQRGFWEISERLLQPVACSLGACAVFKQLIKPLFNLYKLCKLFSSCCSPSIRYLFLVLTSIFLSWKSAAEY